MALTRDFQETIRARAQRDPKFRRELLREGITALVEGDIATAKTILRDYINATPGFTKLADATQIPSKSLMRMLGPSGNPRAQNLETARPSLRAVKPAPSQKNPKIVDCSSAWYDIPPAVQENTPINSTT